MASNVLIIVRADQPTVYEYLRSRYDGMATVILDRRGRTATASRGGERRETHGPSVMVVEKSEPCAALMDLSSLVGHGVDALVLERAHQLHVAAQEANQAKENFLATLVHELRWPLSAILNWAHVLRRRRPDDTTALRAIDAIERNTRLQARLVEDLIDVSTIAAGHLRLQREPVDVVSLIEREVETARLAAELKGLRLNSRLDSAVGVIVGDPARLQQVFGNLVSNAIKFTPSGGMVEVRVTVGDQCVEITVEDNGEGISPDFLPHVFDRFRQGPGQSSRPGSGLGLGLAIVRHLVELHDGTVFAESPGMGGGARFTVRLPVDKRLGEGQQQRLDRLGVQALAYS